MESLIFSIIFNSLISFYSYKSKKLTLLGTLTAFIIGLITYATSIIFYIVLIVFFLSSSRFTKMGSKRKEQISTSHKKEKIRGVAQVICNGGIPTLFCLIHLIMYGNLKNICLGDSNFYREFLIFLVISYYSTCNADTWASEVGVLSKTTPVLITNFRNVPAGTNGGVTVAGTIMSALGGLVIGSTAEIAQICTCQNVKYFKMSIFGLISGLIGSLIDSILGALLQETIYNKNTKQIISKEEYLLSKTQSDYVILGSDILSNNSVNIVSATITSFLTSYLYLTLIN